MEHLRVALDDKLVRYNCKEFICNDPISFPHSFTRREDIEIAALLASVIAWGNRKMILASGKKMFYDIMHSAPYDYVMSGEWEQLDDSLNIHRTFFASDFKYICRGLKSIYNKFSTIWDGVSAAELMIPLDVHVARTARLLGIVSRKQNDRKTVEQLTAQLRKLSPDDPVKYDFALFGVGEAGDSVISEMIHNTK